jgi:tetraacyldisaccharide 4'-kinase
MRSIILPPLGALYGAITRGHAVLYERGAFRPAKLERPVISIGNITAGGTGKTPLVEWVARTLAGSEKRVCILTRGYGRENSKRRVLVSDGTTVFSTPRDAGDEPYLLATNLVGVAAVISDANRFAAGLGAIKHLKSDCFVLDDGFQHFRLARDLNVVTIDATDPWGNGQMLPYGRLREPLTGLKRADCFVLTRCEHAENVERVHLELSKLSGDRPIFHSRMKVKQIKNLDGSDTATSSESFSAFCGIGNPGSFFAQLRAEGIEPLTQTSFPDHHSYTQSDVDKLAATAKQAGATSLITTAKDAVKLRSLSFALPCYLLEIELQIENAEGFRRLLIDATRS